MAEPAQLATVRDEASGVEVSSYSQTADELRAALGMEAQAPTPPDGSPPPTVPIGDEPEPEPGKEPSPESDAGKALARKRSSLQARINELTREKYETQRARDDAAARAERLERELETFRKPPSGNGQSNQPHSSDKSADKFPKYAEYLTSHPDAELEDWLEARDTWREQASQRRTAEQHQQQARDAQARSHDERAKHVHASIAEAVQHDPDFLSKVDPRLMQTKALSALGPDEQPTFGNFLVEQIFKSEHPRKLLLHLSNEQEVSRLAQLDPDRVIRELARIEYDLNGASLRPAVPVPSTSHAKPPVKPLGGSPPVDADEPPGDDASDDEHLAYYNRKDLARQRRRG